MGASIIEMIERVNLIFFGGTHKENDRWMKNWMPLHTLPAGAIKLEYMRMQLPLILHYDLQDRTSCTGRPSVSMISLDGVIFQGSGAWSFCRSLKLTIDRLVTSRHRSEMSERLLKAILNTHIPFCFMNTDKFNTADIVKFKYPEKILV